MKAFATHRLLLAAMLATVLAGCAAVREDGPATATATADATQAQAQAQAHVPYSVPF
jgi:outer membrane biogenesis lipoprotein LolB